MAAGAGGCFPGDATVTLSTGETTTMDNVTVGDEVLTYDASTLQLRYDAVVTFLHRSRSTDQTTQYVTVETEYGHRLTLTPGPFFLARCTTVRAVDVVYFLFCVTLTCSRCP